MGLQLEVFSEKPMVVSELIAALQGMPQGYQVEVEESAIESGIVRVYAQDDMVVISAHR